MVSSIGGEREGVESVLRGEVDQYVLDGTGRVLDVPRGLQERLEQLPQVSWVPASATSCRRSLTRFCSPPAELGPPVRLRPAGPAVRAGAD